MISLVIALQCEAKPLIKHFNLNGRQSDGFRLYENDQIRLVVSGIGKIASAAATAYLQGLEPGIRQAWLNIGIAGHPTLAIGEPLLAKKIIDQASDQTWYPPMIFDSNCQRQSLITLDSPCKQYIDDHTQDMEAAGFYAAATRFNSAELVQVFKVVSDNKTQSIDNISATQAEALIAANLDTIDNIVKQLIEINSALKTQTESPETTAWFLEQWHFTATQKHQLTRLLQRWQALQPNSRINESAFSTVRNSKEVIKLLEKQLEALPIFFNTPS